MALLLAMVLGWLGGSLPPTAQALQRAAEPVDLSPTPASSTSTGTTSASGPIRLPPGGMPDRMVVTAAYLSATYRGSGRKS